ncbi:YlbE-like family protein [Bacillus marinisedimentorum]|uniref:YlbE-like family protein n=1 Tax=Bacillus marinisedimentorum TaxID=1821260 RepID=UPI000871D0F6|nr:YlbE-like family protein [Bacillus marinisedimentorum]
MRKEVQQFVNANSEMKRFLREQPQWYRKLGRNPFLISSIEREMQVYYGKTFAHKIDRAQEGIQSAAMMLELLKIMGSNDGNMQE